MHFTLRVTNPSCFLANKALCELSVDSPPLTLSFAVPQFCLVIRFKT